MLDPNGANDRQLNSRQFAKFVSRPYPCLSVVKEKALQFSALSVDGRRLNFREGIPNMR
jgi:hypothetical protein